MKYTDKLNLRKPEGGEYYSVEDFNGNADLIDAAITGKINKPAEYVAGNFAAVSASGNIEDSGKKSADFADANHNHDAIYASIAEVDSKADKTFVESALENKASKKLLWHDLPLRNGYKGNTDNPPRFAKDDLGFVHLRGYLLAATNGGVIPNSVFADLPIGFNNRHGVSVTVAGSNSNDTTLYTDSITLIVRDNGAMVLGLPRYVDNYLGAGINLDGVNFYCD